MHGRCEIPEEALGARPTVESLTQFLKEDRVIDRTLRAAAAEAGVGRAEDDLLVVAEEDVARLAHLGLNNLLQLREACERRQPAVSNLLVAWRQDSDNDLTPQELLWALTYILAAEDDQPLDAIRALIANERWWQRATDEHRGRFLDGIASQLAIAR